MDEGKKVIIIDEDQNGKITSDEIIGVTSESIRNQKNDLAKKADKYAKKQLEIKAKKERVMDKSFEL